MTLLAQAGFKKGLLRNCGSRRVGFVATKPSDVTLSRKLMSLREVAKGGTTEVGLRKSLPDISAANGGSLPKIRSRLQKNEAGAILLAVVKSANSGFSQGSKKGVIR